MWKNYIRPFLSILAVSIAMLLLISLISNKVYYNNLLSFIGYFYITLFFFKWFKNRLSAFFVLMLIFATMLLLQSFTIYTWFVWDTYGLPLIVSHYLGTISAYFYYKYKSPSNILLFLLSSSFVVFMFFQGWDYWLHRINHGTFPGVVTAHNLPTKFEAFDDKSLLITDNSFQNKTVLLDFWYSGCGICFEKFPQLQSAYEKYRNDKSVVIFAVNKPIEEDKPNQAFDMIQAEGYTFPVVVTKDEDLAEKWGVKGYPTTFVINPNGQIVYKGSIEGAIQMVDDLKSNLNSF